MKNILFVLFSLATLHSWAYINPDLYNRPVQANSNNTVDYRTDCAQGTAEIDMDVNNVRARLLTGGDVWWNLDQGLYVVPAVEAGSGIEPVSSIFAGAVWLGGFDNNGNLKLACQTYRSNTSNDFWPGPLTDSAFVEAEICRNWDRFFEVQGSEIDEHRNNFATLGTPIPLDLIPGSILYWPGVGNQYFEEEYGFQLPEGQQGLGAFFDRNENGLYEPELGDFPQIDIRGCGFPEEDDIPYPDEMIFWIYNDNGGVHTNTNGDPILMEVQVQTFAFRSTDELNDMTFQRYKLINRATDFIDSTYFAMWVDPDLGCYTDDYVGCDVSRSLAIIYNQDDVDGEVGEECFGVNTYGSKVPALGVDYFRGPLDLDEIVFVGIDTATGDSLFGPLELGMSTFTYYNNGGIAGNPPQTTDPEAPEEYYNLLTGRWRDGTPFTFGGTAFNPGSTEEVDYVFPDLPNNIDGWSMCSENAPFGDRRTVQASGPFRLRPGAVNELIIGVPWVSELEYPCPDITALLRADDLAQGLFDNCFRIIDGPDAPDVDVVELDRELILILTNDSIRSNNAFEEYEEIDFTAPNDVSDEDKTLRFEGYKVFQLARNEEVPVDDINTLDPARARLIYDVDLRNGVERMYNWEAITDPTGVSQELIWIPSLQNEGSNTGIRKSLRVTEDQFATTDRRLVNHRNYYFLAVAYAHNEYEPFDPETGIGQRRPFLVGRRNTKVTTGTPRPIIYENLNAAYGDGPIVTRIDGRGTGENYLRISKAQREAFLEEDFLDTINRISYAPGLSPIDIQVINPFAIKDGEYLLEFSDSDMGDTELDTDARWRITELSSGEIYEGPPSITTSSDEIFGDLGFSVFVSQVEAAGNPGAQNNGAVGSSGFYEDPTGVNWFAAERDQPAGGFNVLNYIKTDPGEADELLDPEQNFSNLGGSGWNPFYLTDFRITQPAPNPQVIITPGWVESTVGALLRPNMGLDRLNNVDVVFTSDKSKWSRCVVVETATTFYTSVLGKETEGGNEQFDLRAGESVGLEDADGDGLADPDQDGFGMGWFPGYAVDVETGRRLNIFFGENSTYSAEDTLFFPDGNVYTRDMMFNPSADRLVIDPEQPLTLENYIGGGQHMIYVTNQDYDGCQDLREQLDPSRPNLFKTRILDEVTWTCIPYLAEGTELLSYADGLIPNDYTVELRVGTPYSVSIDVDPNSGAETELGTGENGFHPAYIFSFEGVESQDLQTGSERDDALANISAVPNPYYGFSAYETNEKFRVVRLTNLPPQCNVTIYSMDGRFIRSFRRNVVGMSNTNRSNPGIPQDQEVPYLEWDLTNYSNIPVAAGVYLIHVEAPGLGERTIKWFGVNRKFNPSNFQ